MIDLEHQLILLLIVDLQDPIAIFSTTNTDSVFLSVFHIQVLQSNSSPKEADGNNTISSTDDHIYTGQLLLCESIFLFIVDLHQLFVNL